MAEITYRQPTSFTLRADFSGERPLRLEVHVLSGQRYGAPRIARATASRYTNGGQSAKSTRTPAAPAGDGLGQFDRFAHGRVHLQFPATKHFLTPATSLSLRANLSLSARASILTGRTERPEDLQLAALRPDPFQRPRDARLVRWPSKSMKKQ